MDAQKNKDDTNFYQLFNTMLEEKSAKNIAENYLRDIKGIDRSIIYNELIARKLIGYCPERKALSFPLMRGFLVVGIQYLNIETTEVEGKVIAEGQEYFHEGSDLETGIFNMQKNLIEAAVTNGILDLLSTGMTGLSLPRLTNLSRLKILSDMNAMVCFTKDIGRDIALKKVREILPNAKIIALPGEFRSLNHMLLTKGQDSVKGLFLDAGTEGAEKHQPSVEKDKNYKDVICRYFTDAGPFNTNATLEAAKKRAEELSIRKIVLSSCSGATARKALELFGAAFTIIVVTHVTGFREPNFQELPEAEKTYLTDKGAHVVTAHHAFGGVGRAFRNKTGTYQMDEIIAYTLRTFGQGTKTAIEIALMASDAGLVRTDEDIISIGGTVHGVDTALVIRGANTQNFFDLKVKEVVCKPSSF